MAIQGWMLERYCDVPIVGSQTKYRIKPQPKTYWVTIVTPKKEPSVGPYAYANPSKEAAHAFHEQHKDYFNIHAFTKVVEGEGL